MAGQHGSRFVPGGVHADCRKVHGRQPCVAARVDAREGFQVHVHVERHAVVGAVARDLDAERGDLAQAGKIGAGHGCRRIGLLRALGQQGVAARIVQPHVDARRAGHPVARDAEMRERADRGLFHAVDVFLHVVAGAPQIDERIGHHLPGAVEGDLPAAVGGDHGDVARGQQVVRAAREALGEMGCVLAHPEGIGRVVGALRGEGLHGVHGLAQVRPPEHPHLHRRVLDQSTTFTIGCEESARYRSSSCSRLVAVTVRVTPR